MNYALGDISFHVCADIVRLDLSRQQKCQWDGNPVWSSIILLGQDTAGSTNHRMLSLIIHLAILSPRHTRSRLWSS